MPMFSVVMASEARASIANEKRALVLGEYIGYIQRIGPGEAGMLTAGEGETTQAVRRRLSAAAELLGRSLEVRRSGNAVYVYFWAREGRRHGRPRKTAPAGQASSQRGIAS
ncbi:MAG: hypothetical protein OXL97_00715 [Chloroflexota bacterium]|nr:hypothetical protein [Chloroflexota bacterium]MDE2883665.1 hypothetical protein [Chloroflexota bacterium]